jgi:hypothetical protein
MARLRATILKLEPIIIVLDPMRELHELSENDADEMGPLLRPLRQITHETNTAIVLNHHMNRGGTARGSTAIRASVDQEWAFERTDDGKEQENGSATGTITIVGRYGPREIIGVKLGDGLRWKPADPRLIMGQERSARDRVLETLRGAGDWLDVEAIIAATGDEKKTVQNTISRLLRETPPSILVAGTGYKNDPRRFRIAESRFADLDGAPRDDDVTNEGKVISAPWRRRLPSDIQQDPGVDAGP